MKCDGTRVETRFRLSAKRTSPFKSAGASVQSTTGSRGVRISGSNAGYTMFRGSVKSICYAFHSPVSPFTSLPVRHRVPSHFNWTLLLSCLNLEKRIILTKAVGTPTKSRTVQSTKKLRRQTVSKRHSTRLAICSVTQTQWNSMQNNLTCLLQHINALDSIRLPCEQLNASSCYFRRSLYAI